ncbi:MAG: SPOR domain-containing protein [Alphaproteobacteria bacterium]|nr:SPOR domain-containing protein [Alphaproteobacteria bacterium]
MSGTDPEKQKTSFRLVILIGFIVLAIGIAGGGFWLSLQSGTTQELPVLRADKTPFKFKPEDRGGKVIPHQDSLVLEILEGLSENDNQSEILRLPDAAPELPPVALQIEDDVAQDEQQPDTRPADDLPDETPNDLLENSNDNTQIASSNSAQKTTIEPKLSADQINLTSVIDDNNTSQQGEVIGEAKEDKQVKDAPIIAPVTKPEPPKQIAGKKTHKVQLAAFAKQDKAKQQAAILMEKHKNRLDGIMLEVTKIDTGSSGIYWRVITQPLNETLALSTCDLLKSAGQDCIVRKIRQEL